MPAGVYQQPDPPEDRLIGGGSDGLRPSVLDPATAKIRALTLHRIRVF
jgi:hypothetical protein